MNSQSSEMVILQIVHTYGSGPRGDDLNRVSTEVHHTLAKLATLATSLWIE